MAGDNQVEIGGVSSSTDRFEDDAAKLADLLASARDRVEDPSYWEELEQRLPPDLRPGIVNQLREIKQRVRLAPHHEILNEACRTLEKHDREIKALRRNAGTYLEKAHALFSGDRFESFHISLKSLSSAFREVGLPPPGRQGEAFVTWIQQVVDLLVPDEERRKWFIDLSLMIPNLVDQRNYLDAWLVLESADQLADPEMDKPGVFLVCLVFLALEAWDKEQANRYDALLQSLGVDPETIRNAGPGEAIKILETLQSHPDFERRTQELLSQDEEWVEQAMQQSDNLNRDACDLFDHPHSTHLMPDDEEVLPWLDVLHKRLTAQLDLLDMEDGRVQDTPENVGHLSTILLDTAAEMSVEVFNEERLAALRNSLVDWESKASDQEDSTLSRQLRAAIFMVPTQVAKVADNLFLNTLCAWAIRTRLEGESGQRHVR